MALFIVASIAMLLPLFGMPTADAHSALIESIPAEKAVTEKSPTTLKLRFNEPVELDLANVTIYDRNSLPVFTHQPESNSERSANLSFSLPKLKEGTYTVQWSVVSLDGHPVSGSYYFSVGKATSNGANAIADGNQSSGVMLIIFRTIAQGAIVLLAGVYIFSIWAEKRKYPALRQLITKLNWVYPILLVASVAELVAYINSLPPGLVQAMFKGRWDLLLHFPFVLMLFAQLACILLLMIPGMVRGWYIVLWLALVITPAFGGHVWGLAHPYAALIPRIIHQLGISLWLGALLYMILIRRKGKVHWEEFRSFFVNRVLVFSGLVILSGIAMVFFQTSWKAIFEGWMNWSTLLLCKIVLTLLMLCLALMQTLKWKKNGEFSTFRLIRTEWLIGIVLILLGVWLSQSAYPLPKTSYDKALTASESTVQVHMKNLHAGNKTMTIEIPPLKGKKPKDVSVTIFMTDHDMKAGPYPVKEMNTGNYLVSLPFVMSGNYRYSITANYPGGKTTEWTDQVSISSANN